MINGSNFSFLTLGGFFSSVSLLLLLSFSTSHAASSWSSFRGDVKNTALLPIPCTYSPSLTPDWEIALEGVSNGSPIVSGDESLIFFIATFGGDSRVVALSSTDGSSPWSYSCPAGCTFTSKSVALDDAANRVFVGASDGNVYSMNSLVGGSILIGNTGVSTSVNSVPMFDSARNQVYVGSSNFLRCLNSATLAPIWSFDVSGTPTAVAIDATQIYVGSSSGDLFAVNPATGLMIWTYTDYYVQPIVAAPMIGTTQVYFGDLEGYLYGINKATGTRNWLRGGGGEPPISSELAMFPDERILAFFGSTMTIYASDGNLITQRIGTNSAGAAVVGPTIDMNDNAFYTSSSGTSIQIWDFTLSNEPVATSDQSWNLGTLQFALISTGYMVLGIPTAGLVRLFNICQGSPSVSASVGTSSGPTGSTSSGPTSSTSSGPTSSTSPTLSLSIASSISSSVTLTPTISESRSVTPTISITPTTSYSSSSSPSLSPTFSASISSSRTPTSSTSPTLSISITSSTSSSVTLTPTISESRSVTPTISITSSSSSSPSFSATITISSSVTATISFSSSLTPTVSLSPTVSSSASITGTLSPPPSSSASSSSSPSSTATTSLTPSVTSSVGLSLSNTLSVSALPSASPLVSSPLTSESLTISFSNRPRISRRISSLSPSTTTKTPRRSEKNSKEEQEEDYSSCLRNNDCETKLRISSTSTKITGNTTVVPIQVEGNLKIGKLTILSGALPLGCIVAIRQGRSPFSNITRVGGGGGGEEQRSRCSSKSKKKKNEDEDSDGQKTEKENREGGVGSVIVRITLDGDCEGIDKDSPVFARAVELELKGLASGREDSCLGFYREEEEKEAEEEGRRTQRWSCLSRDKDTYKINNKKDEGRGGGGRRRRNDTALYQVKLSHFTTFAVLLFGGGLPQEEEDREEGTPCSKGEEEEVEVLWILSCAFLSSSILLVVLIAILHWKSQRFRAIVAGHFAKSLKDTQRRLLISTASMNQLPSSSSSFSSPSSSSSSSSSSLLPTSFS